MTRKSKITKRELAATLRESIFAPNKPGPLKVIVDVGDSRYYRQRALELITLSLDSPTEDQCNYYLEQAITLLAVAKHVIRIVDVFEKDKIDSQKAYETLAKQNQSVTTHTDQSMRVAGDPVKEEKRTTNELLNNFENDMVPGSLH